MRILISDTSCLIDLRKASLLEAFVQLPYDLAIPDVLFEQELVNFSSIEKQLITNNLKIVSLPGKEVIKVQSINQDFPALTLNDCFAFITATQYPNCILMTGDRRLRDLATSSGIEVHGVLWGIDEMHRANTATVSQLYSALLLFKADSTVRLPKNDLRRWIERYYSLLDR